MLTHPDGRVYKGPWKNGKEDGEGEFVSVVNGEEIVRSGRWEKGRRLTWLN